MTFKFHNTCPLFLRPLRVTNVFYLSENNGYPKVAAPFYGTSAILPLKSSKALSISVYSTSTPLAFIFFIFFIFKIPHRLIKLVSCRSVCSLESQIFESVKIVGQFPPSFSSCFGSNFIWFCSGDLCYQSFLMRCLMAVYGYTWL